MGSVMEMSLKDTVSMMCSSDYKERFEAEYSQLVIRYRKLKAMRSRWCKGELDFEPKCPITLLGLQIKAMSDYIAVLEARAVIEGIELELM